MARITRHFRPFPRERLWKIGAKPVVLAHRGGGNEALENSLGAFALMEAKGFHFIETDSHATSDGVVVLFHDDVLERTTNGTGHISSYTWERLAQVRDNSGQSLVRLDAALQYFPHVIFNVDAKEWSVVEPLAATILEADAVAHVSLSSFSEARLRKLRKLLPGARSSLGVGAIATLVLAAKLPKFLGRLVTAVAIPGPRHGVEAVQVPIEHMHIKVLTPRFIDLCHRHGLAVHAWTINRPSTMRTLLAMGVDGIVTDEPTRARYVIDEFWSGR